jgi:hypothetical protein
VSARRLLAVALLVAAWTAAGAAAPASRGGHVTADEPQYLLTAISLGEDLDLDVSDERAEQRFREFHRADLPRQEEVRDDGVAVSPHDPLLPAYLALPMRVGGWVAAKLALAALAGALAAALAWTAVARFGVPAGAATASVLAFACAPPLAFYGTQVYPELPAALAVTLALAALTGPLGARGVAAGVACVVALPWLSVKYAPVAAVLAAALLALLVRRGARRLAAAATAALGAAGALFGVAHVAWYGGLTPYASGSHFGGDELSVVGRDPDYAGRAIRLVGLLVDRDFGLAAWHPAFLLAVPALAALGARRPRGWLLLAGVAAAGWLNATFVALTMHGWWWPGRQTVVVLPAVVLAVAWWSGSRPAARRALGALGVLGASVYAWLVAQAVLGDLTVVVTFETVTHPLVRAWRLLLPDYRDLRAGDWALHAAWLAALAACSLAAVRADVRRPARFPIPTRRLRGATTP